MNKSLKSIRIGTEIADKSHNTVSKLRDKPAHNNDEEYNDCNNGKYYSESQFQGFFLNFPK